MNEYLGCFVLIVLGFALAEIITLRNERGTFCALFWAAIRRERETHGGCNGSDK